VNNDSITVAVVAILMVLSIVYIMIRSGGEFGQKEIFKILGVLVVGAGCLTIYFLNTR